MKKEFTTAAEELITGIQTPDAQEPEAAAAGDQSKAQPDPDTTPRTEQEPIRAKPITAELPPKDFYMRYVEARTERVNCLFSKSLVKKLTAEAKSRKMSKNGLINAILESYFADSSNE